MTEADSGQKNKNSRIRTNGSVSRMPFFFSFENQKIKKGQQQQIRIVTAAPV
jgi:hypothetical protein